jgi:hypothetical protein
VATALLVDAASFLAIAILLAFTSGLPGVHLEREAFRQRFSDGFRFARRNLLVRVLLIGEAVAMMLFTLVIPIEVIYAKESLETTSAGFGILMASWGVGIVVGSLIYLLVKKWSALTLIILSTAAIGAAYLGMAAADTLLVACLVSVVGGAGNGVQWISVVTALQEVTPIRHGSWACSNRSAPRCPASATSLAARSSPSDRRAPHTRSRAAVCSSWSLSQRRSDPVSTAGRLWRRRSSWIRGARRCRSRTRSRQAGRSSPAAVRPASGNTPERLNLT